MSIKTKRKGISLVIETIIVLILAITVLSVLLIFLNITVNPKARYIELEDKRIQLCADFARKNPNCDDVTSAPDTVNKIFDVCSELNKYTNNKYEYCVGWIQSEDNIDCIKQCCNMFCP